MYIDTPVTDASFAFRKGFPRVNELRTGPTPVSTFANIGKLKGPQAVDVSTSKAMSYTVLSRLLKLAAVSTNVVSGKVNMTSLAKLPKLEAAGFSGDFNQPLKPLLNAKSMDSV